jgi:hypothetical protein
MSPFVAALVACGYMASVLGFFAIFGRDKTANRSH